MQEFFVKIFFLKLIYLTETDRERERQKEKEREKEPFPEGVTPCSEDSRTESLGGKK